MFERKKRDIISHFQDAGMLSVCVQKENAARSPPSVPPPVRFVEYLGSLLDVILIPRGEGRGSISKHRGMLEVDV